MYFKTRILIRISGLLVSIITLGSCDWHRNMRGYDYIPDMIYSQAYETYSTNPNFKDTMTMRVPVPGTVPRGIIPFRYTIDPESRIKAGVELVNPYPHTDEIIAQGKKIYTTYCIGCHGERGKGDGQLFSSGLYPAKPREISGDVASKLKDGEIFHTISLGFGPMGPHRVQIKPEDRWKLVHYVRELQRAQQDSIRKIQQTK